MKRLFDFFFAIFLIIIFFIPALFIILLIKYQMGSPVIYKQKRVGLNGKVFTLYKFRSMSENINTTEDEDARITPLGSWLRRTSLDEVPELVNILKGDMSFVGPRPLLIEYLPYYSREQARRHQVKPGLTGWAQIHGRNLVEWGQRFKLDVWYVENQSFSLDMKILFKTVSLVIDQVGISSENGAIQKKFTGND